MPHAMGDFISGIGNGIAAADIIGYRAPTWYQSDPRRDLTCILELWSDGRAEMCVVVVL